VTTPKDNGGPAFPQTNDSWNGSEHNPPTPTGMTLRDWFAGMALQGMVANSSIDAIKPQEYASDAYLYADAMIMERNKV
jgi:hypothetical protein